MSRCQGEDVREGDSPSWFNPAETVLVVTYLQGLLGNNPPLSPDDIGIITPYRKQVRQAISDLLNSSLRKKWRWGKGDVAGFLQSLKIFESLGKMICHFKASKALTNE